MLNGMYYVKQKCGNHINEDGSEGRPISVTSCCGGSISIPNTFTILSMFHIFPIYSSGLTTFAFGWKICIVVALQHSLLGGKYVLIVFL
jgi:hypothetical protein